MQAMTMISATMWGCLWECRHIHPFNFKETMSYRMQLFVELGNNVWLQDVESKYYTFHLPTKNSSGLVGRLSLLACDEYITTLWNQSFSVQSDVGAYRLDIIEAGEIFESTIGFGNTFLAPCNPGDARIDIYSKITASTMVGVARDPQGRTVNSVSKLKSKQAYSRQVSQRLQQTEEQRAAYPVVASPELYHSNSLRETKLAGELSKMQPGDTELLQMPYPQKMILYATIIQKCYLAVFMACFAFIQLLVALMQKSILLLEASVSAASVRAPLSCNNNDLGAWDLCLSNSMGNGGYFIDSKSGQGLPNPGKFSLEEAWHFAEQYLNEAIESDCQGAYFSYNCTTPQQETPESALGRWNRDNAGRLIRQLWP